MKLEAIRDVAKLHGLQIGKRSKSELIKSIQMEEGNFDCYATAYAGVCDQSDCLWREDCFAAAKAGG
jgi:hypothetical protein